ncbi:ABC transporter substrate-binding protein [Nocardioides caeni]|uniref:ABC transporter substrate-binding protein n=1 Tax=Nocardioides caeni TaxID=574700 RepID=A0A4S8N3Z1_9ACTN|nr:ABC transporter substrate-binding protein [Nocardioides caeni]THV10777.1 ABC transporter substrate-binding protein [Nocardioides caeni]
MLLLARPDVVDEATRRQFLGIIAAAGLLTACGDDRDSKGSSGSSGSSTRTVDDVFGTVEVPTDPQRVVAMEQQVLGNLLALGFPIERIVGFGKDDIDLDNLDFIAAPDVLKDLPSVGTFSEPNAELLAAAQPDLILAVADTIYTDFYAPIFKALNSVGAPVFAAYNGYTTLDEAMRLLADVGRAVGLEEKATEAEQHLRDRIADVVSRLDAAGERPSVGFLRATSDGLVANNVMPLLDELGLPGDRPTPEEFYVEVSAENLTEVFVHDVLFVSDGDDPDKVIADLEANPLWSRLPAVRAGRVQVVPDVVWGSSYSVQAFERQLDDIEQALLG